VAEICPLVKQFVVKNSLLGRGVGNRLRGKNYKEVEKDKHAIFSLDILTTRKYSGLSNPLHKTLLKLLSSLRSQGE